MDALVAVSHSAGSMAKTETPVKVAAALERKCALEDVMVVRWERARATVMHEQETAKKRILDDGKR